MRTLIQGISDKWLSLLLLLLLSYAYQCTEGF